MIIDDQHRFVFVHIPKCAGTSVRQILQKFDASQGRFSPPLRQDHPQLGRLDMVHIPLAILRQYFPQEYQKVKDYFSVAVLRDPFARFSSSLYQRLALYGENSVKGISQKQLKAALEEAIAFLAAQPRDANLPYDYIHFQQQSSYVFDLGERLVHKLYTPQTLTTMYCDIGKLVGEQLELSRGVHANRAVVYKSKSRRALGGIISPLYTPSVQKFLPITVKERIKKAFYKSPNNKFGGLFDSETVRDFVSEYYAEDIALYKSVVAGND